MRLKGEGGVKPIGERLLVMGCSDGGGINREEQQGRTKASRGEEVTICDCVSAQRSVFFIVKF